MENIEIQRPCFDKIGIVFIGVDQREQFGKSLIEVKLKN
jgi:hypothetical protein